MRIAAIQLNPKVGDLANNTRQLREAYAQAAQQGADLVVTSELAVTGYPPKDLLLNRSFVAAAEAAARGMAPLTLQGPPLIVGAPLTHSQGGIGLFNACYCFDQGQLQATYAKRLLPNYDVFDEERYFDAGAEPGMWHCRGQRLGLSICEDIWNDSPQSRPHPPQANPLAELRKLGFDLLINLSSSPFSLGKPQRRMAMLAEIAQKNQAPLVYVNQVGGNDDLVFDGRSCLLNAQGQTLGLAPAFAPEVAIFDAQAPAAHPAFPGKAEEAFHALVLGTRDYIHKCGFKKAVLGLSGGVDSALTAVIAVHALGPGNVTGLLMPSPFSSQGSLDDAHELARRLGIATHTLAIEPAMAGFRQVVGDQMNLEAGLTLENLQARIRGNLLMAHSNATGAMLLTTGNKSELAVGYCTIYGDMAGGLAVISDLPKTQVYAVCHWINQTQGNPIPQPTLTKAPSAELRPNQTDQDSLPPYDLLDELLEHFIGGHRSLSEVIALGYAPETATQVARLLYGAEFKRKQAAPGIKLTDQAFGTGWRMPLAAARF